MSDAKEAGLTLDVEDTSEAALQVSESGRAAFLDQGYGLSVHWGLYSLLSGNEWVYYLKSVPYDEYQGLMARFEAPRFDADEWADLMLESGQRFLLVTAKHHDGFCLWDTNQTEFKTTNAAIGRDVLAQLAEALRRRGLALHFYYSLVDWTQPDYRADWDAYVAYYHEQLRELCTWFGPIGGFLFDGYWPRERPFDGRGLDYFGPGRKPEWLSFDLAGAYDLIHRLQPNAVITNNTHVLPLKGEDYQVWEQDVPGQNTLENNTTQIGGLPVASWWNTNAGWSYEPEQHRVKCPEDILANHDTLQKLKGVFMLNVGPRSFGDIHPEEQMVLRRVGQRLRERSANKEAG
ncbi:MAG: alpha-L-fucosidase [Gemmatimonadetes bacterium]|nr:alpha-L-fucosidase [Gemmatimonadota bacterium]MBT7863088.1 alpha-L-fucosidase [Gemmatimonadota bacterium]